MSNTAINPYDLAVAAEVIPFVRLRLKMLRESTFGREFGRVGNVLIVAPCILGDCLSYMPAVQTFAQQNSSRIDLVVSPDLRSLAERLKGIHRVYVASSSYNRPSERAKLSETVIPSEYDLMIVMRLSRDAYKLIRHIKCKKIITCDFTLFKYVLHLAKCSLLKRPVVQSREIMYEACGLPYDSRDQGLMSLFDLEDGAPDISTFVPALQCREKKVLIHMGSGWKVKLWSEDRWADLLERIHSLGSYRLFVVGKGAEEKAVLQRIQGKLGFEIHSLVDAVNLWQLFLVMKRSDCFIGIDSGPRNLAHYADLRSITLMNPAAVNNFAPFDSRDIVVEKPNRFPANIVNTRRGASLLMISVDEVFEAFKRLTSHTAG